MKLTTEGAEKLKKEIEVLKKQRLELGRYKASAAANEGDTWHDNFAFEQTEIQERALIRQIHDLEMQLNTAEIIQVTKDTEKVSIGSKVTVLLKFDDGYEEKCILTLDSNVNVKDDVVSINSPLGESIFKKKVGYESSYQVNNSVIEFKILAIND